MGVALSCTFYNYFFGERHCAGKKEADLCRNEVKYLRRKWRNQGFSNFTYVIVAVYFTTVVLSLDQQQDLGRRGNQKYPLSTRLLIAI